MSRPEKRDSPCGWESTRGQADSWQRRVWLEEEGHGAGLGVGWESRALLVESLFISLRTMVGEALE